MRFSSFEFFLSFVERGPHYSNIGQEEYKRPTGIEIGNALYEQGIAALQAAEAR